MRKNTKGMGGRRKGGIKHAMKMKMMKMASKPPLNTNATDALRRPTLPKLPKMKGVKF